MRNKLAALLLALPAFCFANEPSAAVGALSQDIRPQLATHGQNIAAALNAASTRLTPEAKIAIRSALLERMRDLNRISEQAMRENLQVLKSARESSPGHLRISTVADALTLAIRLIDAYIDTRDGDFREAATQALRIAGELLENR